MATSLPTATLKWFTHSRLNLKLRNDDGIVNLNQVYDIWLSSPSPPLPNGLKMFDDEDDYVKDASFIDVQQKFSIEYLQVRYCFLKKPPNRPAPSPAPGPQETIEDHQIRFRRLLAEDAAIFVTDAVMKSVVFHFASQMIVVGTPSEAADLYKRASRIPSSKTEIALRENNTDVGNICPGTDSSTAIILEAFQEGSPCLIKITDRENVDHEMSVWEAIEASLADGDPRNHHLVPLKKLEFERSAIVHAGKLSSGFNDLPGDYRAGILMEKYQSALSRCKIHLREAMLLKYGEQLKMLLRLCTSVDIVTWI